MSVAQEIHNEWIHGQQPDDDREPPEEIEPEEDEPDYDEAVMLYERNLER